MRPLATFTLFTALAVSLASTASAQMSGAYTINPTGSGARNFKTFTAASTALSKSGISGPVDISVVNGTFTESWSLSTIQGTSATNPVTIRSAAPGFLKLTKLRSTSGNILTLNGGVNNLILDGLVFEAVSGAIAIQSLYVSSSRMGVDDVEVKNCTFTKGVVPPSNFGAIRLQTTKRWNIHHNEFDVTGTALYSQGALEMVLAYNKFNNNDRPYCLSLWNSNRSRCRVFNNLFTGKIATECIRVGLSHYQIDFWHNTFVIETSGWVVNNRACCSVAWNTYYNNIFVVTGTGGAIWNRDREIETDHNLFFVASKKIGRHNNVDHTTLSSWSGAIQSLSKNGANDTNSIVGDPQFSGGGKFTLKPTSPAIGKGKPKPGGFTAGAEVKDDIVGLMRGSKKDIGAYELTGWSTYGAGCPGTGNQIPVLAIGGNVAPGDQASIDLTNALANANTALTVGLKQSSVNLGGSCALLNQPLLLLFLKTNGSGAISVPAAIPASAPVLGVDVFVQYGVADPKAAGGIATTEGAAVRL